MGLGLGAMAIAAGSIDWRFHVRGPFASGRLDCRGLDAYTSMSSLPLALYGMLPHLLEPWLVHSHC